MDEDSKTDGTLTVVDRFTQVSEDVFCINGSYRSAPGLTFPVRCTIIRFPGNKLIVYSPFNPSLIDVSSLGSVEAIIVPNMVHWSYAQAMKEANLDATMYTSPSVKKRFPDRDWGTIVEDDKPFALAPGVKLICISHLEPFQEILMLHEPTKTLMVADFAFNLTEHALQVASTGARWYVWFVNGRRKLCIGTTLESFVRPYCKSALPQVGNLLSMDWDAVVPCHGDLVESGAKEAFRENTYQFMKDSAERRSSSWAMAVGIAILAVAIGVFLYKYAKSSALPIKIEPFGER